MTCTVYICWRRSFFHRLKKHIDLIHCLMFHILAVFDKTDGYLTWSEWWEYFDLIFVLFSLSLSILWLTRLMGIWSGHVPSAAIVQTERHWSDLRIDDHHSLRWTQANVDDHCTLEVNKKHLLACWVWNKNFVESNVIIENNLLCFEDEKLWRLVLLLISMMQTSAHCSILEASSKQCSTGLWVNRLKGCLILSK